MKTLILLCTIFIFFNAYSQENSKSNYVSFTIGVATPYGSFRVKSLFDGRSGFAKTGQQVSIGWAKLLSKKLGFTITLNGQRNPVDLNAIGLQAFNVLFLYPNYGSQLPAPPPTSNVPLYFNGTINAKKASWLSAALQAGGYGEFPLSVGSNMKVIARVTAGALYARNPKLEAMGYTDSTISSLSQNKSSAIGFTYAVGSGFKYEFDNGMSFLINLNYLAATKLNFKKMVTVISEVKYPGTPNASTSMAQITNDINFSVKILSLSVGIGLQL